MKQNPGAVVGEVAKSACIGLDELDGTVEPFRTGIADSVLTEVEQPFFVAPEHLDYLFDWFQLAAHGIVRPCLEEAFGSTLVAVAPELGEVLLNAPRPAGFQVELIQGPKRDGLGAAPVWVLSQPSPLAARQWRRAYLGHLAVLLLSHGIDCFTKILGDVKLVVHDVCLGHAKSRCTHVRRPHVHGHRLDRCALRRRERFQQTYRCFKLSLRNQIKYPRAVNVGQDAGVGVTPLGTLLIDAKVRNRLFGSPQHAALHCTNHDGVDRAPGQSCQSTYGLRGGTGLKQLDDKAGHHGGDTAVALRPGHSQFFDAAVAVLELGDACFDKCLELAGVKVAPLALRPSIDVRSLGRVRWVRPHLALLQNDFDHHPLVYQRQVYLLDRPRGLQSKKLLIQCGVFHIVLERSEKLNSLAARKNHSEIDEEP